MTGPVSSETGPVLYHAVERLAGDAYRRISELEDRIGSTYYAGQQDTVDDALRGLDELGRMIAEEYPDVALGETAANGGAVAPLADSDMITSAEDNIGTKVNSADRSFPQIANGGENGIIDQTIINMKINDRGEVINPMSRIDYDRIKGALSTQGVEVFAATEGDDLRYMLALGAEGTYSNGRITHIGEIPSRGTMFEEIIHMAQSRQYGELQSTDAIELYAREIEANRKLLRNQAIYKLDDLDIADIERNLAVWEQSCTNAMGVSYDESNYR